MHAYLYLCAPTYICAREGSKADFESGQWSFWPLHGGLGVKGIWLLFLCGRGPRSSFTLTSGQVLGYSFLNIEIYKGSSRKLMFFELCVKSTANIGLIIKTLKYSGLKKKNLKIRVAFVSVKDRRALRHTSILVEYGQRFLNVCNFQSKYERGNFFTY